MQTSSLFQANSVVRCAPSFRHEEVSRVEDQLELCHLEQLRGWFARHRPRSSTSLPGRVRSERRLAGLLTPAEFKEVIAKVLGTRRYDDQLDNLFTKVRRAVPLMATSSYGVSSTGHFDDRIIRIVPTVPIDQHRHTLNVIT